MLSGEVGCYHETTCIMTSSFTIVPGPPSTESIERTCHSLITDAERAVTHQLQHSGLTCCQWTCATLAPYRVIFIHRLDQPLSPFHIV
jgi:hypothetical protein